MTRLFIILLALSIATTALAEYERVSKDATGYDWAEYSMQEKHSYVATVLYIALGTDKDKYPADKIIATLDHLYELAFERKRTEPEFDIEKFFNLPCIIVISGYIGAKAEVVR